MEDELQSTDAVADYLGVGPVTVWRWCREGSLPCSKIGRSWRIRRSALEDSIHKSERSYTLTSQIRSFIDLPDNLFAIAQSRELMYQMDVAFFRVADAHGGLAVKYHRNVSGGPSVDELRAEFERIGLEVSRMEREGRLRVIVDSGDSGHRVEEIKRLASEESERGSIWVNYNWESRLELDVALEQQRELTELIEDSGLVIKTSILESELDEWPGARERRAQVLHSGTIWLSESGLSMSRVSPPPAL